MFSVLNPKSIRDVSDRLKPLFELKKNVFASYRFDLSLNISLGIRSKNFTDGVTLLDSDRMVLSLIAFSVKAPKPTLP